MGEIRAEGHWTSPYATTLEDGRGHRIEVDLPADEGGEDRGSTALELAVLSLAGCIATIFAVVARRRRLRYDAFDISLEADRPPRAATITAVRGTVRVRSDAPPEDVSTAVEITVRTCPVGVLFERAGVPVELRTVVSPSQPGLVAAAGTPSAVEART